MTHLNVQIIGQKIRYDIHEGVSLNLGILYEKIILAVKCMYRMALLRAIQELGGQSSLAKKIGVSRKRINNWLNLDIKIPYQYAILIEEATEGKVKRHELAPYVLLSTKQDILSLQNCERQEDTCNYSSSLSYVYQDLKKEMKMITHLLTKLYEKIVL